MKEDNRGKKGRARHDVGLVKIKLDTVLEYLRVTYPGAVILSRRRKTDYLITVDPYASGHRYFI